MRSQIVPKLRAGVNYWRDLVPLVSALRNPFLKERHWVKVRRSAPCSISTLKSVPPPVKARVAWVHTS